MQSIRSLFISTERTRHLLFLVICLALLAIFWKSLWALAGISLRRDEYSHILMVPLISVLLIYWRRTEIFAGPATNSYKGLISVLIGFTLFGFAGPISGAPSLNVVPALSLSIVGFVIACVGAFLFTFGWPAFRASLFALGFLLFTVPLPSDWLAKIVYFLQEGSSDAAALILSGFGVPFLRDGIVFQLPGVAIKVAEECSGIRSSIALLITTLLAAQILLRSNWRRLALCILVIPIAMLKNGLRIATLSTLAVYVSRDFLFGRLHHSGGFVFFSLGLGVLWGALRLLQIGDGPPGAKHSAPIHLGQPARKIEI